jgi:hypothetical protein
MHSRSDLPDWMVKMVAIGIPALSLRLDGRNEVMVQATGFRTRTEGRLLFDNRCKSIAPGDYVYFPRKASLCDRAPPRTLCHFISATNYPRNRAIDWQLDVGFENGNGHDITRIIPPSKSTMMTSSIRLLW